MRSATDATVRGPRMWICWYRQSSRDTTFARYERIEERRRRAIRWRNTSRLTIGDNALADGSHQ